MLVIFVLKYVLAPARSWTHHPTDQTHCCLSRPSFTKFFYNLLCFELKYIKKSFTIKSIQVVSKLLRFFNGQEHKEILQQVYSLHINFRTFIKYLCT